MRKKLLFVLLVCFTVFLAACLDDEESAENDVNKIIEEAKVDESSAVARVNGEEVKGNLYNLMLTQTITTLQQYGEDIGDQDMIKELTLNAVISQKILSQEVTSKGIEASEEEINENVEQFKANFESEDEFQDYLTQVDLSEAELKDQLAYEIAVEKYMNSELDGGEVTDEQVQQYYELWKEQGGDDVPELSEVEPQIKAQLKQQQKSTELNTKLEQLREEAELETLI